MNPKLETLREIIKRRKTSKILGDPDAPIAYSPTHLETFDRLVKQSIRDSGYAPFHYDRKEQGIAEPWRVYWLNQASCQQIASVLPELIPDLKPNNKMRALLSGCGSLSLFTWLPQQKDTSADPSRLQRVNYEHLSATAAAVQNFLLLLTAGGIENYWASGTLIAKHLFSVLEIPADQQLAAAVFAGYPERVGKVEILPGKQRENRCATESWFREIEYSVS